MPQGLKKGEEIMDFITWMIEEKNILKKSAHDVQSRLNRVQGITKEKNISKNTIDHLEKCEGFTSLSLTVKSQLRRSVRLYLEYKETKN